jgi:DNA-binding transcriptional ArsR family regulator
MDANTVNVRSITRVAALIGEAGRIQMLTALLDGNSHSASELALVASVSPQTASSHLSKLHAGGLIVSERRGRQRLFRLKNSDVAEAIEALGALAQPSKTCAVPELRFARSCYDHLAGVLAISLRNQLLKNGALRPHNGDFIVTPAGKRLLHNFDIDVDSLLALRRSFSRKCLDWTERHPHIGGALGAALLGALIHRKWLVRMRGTRALRLTHVGQREFERAFSIRCPAFQ